MRASKYYISLIYLSFFSFIVFAIPHGVDWQAYSSIYVNFERFYFLREPLGWLVSIAFRDFDNGNTAAALLIGLMLITSSAFILHSDRRMSFVVGFPVLFLLVFSNFFLLLSVNGLRQGLALSFLLFSLGFLMRDKVFFSILFFIAAVASHNSALLFLVVLFSYRFPAKFFVNTGLLLLIPLAPFINKISGKSSQLSVNNNTLEFTVVIVFLLIIMIFFRFLNRNVVSLNNLYAMLGVFSISIAFIQINSVYERIVYYTIPVAVLLVAICLSHIKNEYVIFFVLFFFALLNFFYSLTHPSVIGNFYNL
ncbi:hypothetical protein XMD579_000499 [Marinobacterium sp. xm-d-579]|uniref:EpsG family protein n=1 Tax=Marinobacterium sp. xm-d-579 TaxID=2497734 RepID=UPI0015699432|nr:EpsG family protein [Marinobacterium sp. xm-d-579]NRP35694.1 hypothetical protein [Marinobacterium sp. xm-d-579]